MKTCGCKDNVAPTPQQSDDSEENDTSVEIERTKHHYERGAEPAFFEKLRFVSEGEELSELHAEMTCHCGRMTFTDNPIVDAVSEHLVNGQPRIV